MLFFAFFSAVFSSVVWLIYAVMFANSKLAEEHLMEQDPQTMLILLSVVVLPILVIWMVFGYFSQFLSNRAMNRKQSELLTQLQKNQESYNKYMYALQLRTEAADHIGIENIRKSRLLRLEREKEEIERSFAKGKQVYPDFRLSLLVRLEA